MRLRTNRTPTWPASEATLRALLTALPEGVLIHAGGRITFANPAAQRLFGHGAGELLNLESTAIVQPESARQLEAWIEQLCDGVAVAPLAGIRIVRRDGTTRIAEMAGARMAVTGECSVVAVLRDMTDLLEARTGLADSHADLQRLLAARENIQEEERQRIARELHDDLQQSLAAIRIDIAAASQQLGVIQPEIRLLLDETGNLAAAAIESTHRIINDLRPQMLEDLGLIPALESLVSRFQRRTGIDCKLRMDDGLGEETPIPPLIATCLYRITQESLQNTARHAEASDVEVRFVRNVQGLILLRITDNGRGMNTGIPRNPESFGLMGMQQRVQALGALLRIESRLGAGTTIEVIVPVGHGTPGVALARQAAHNRRLTDTVPDDNAPASPEGPDHPRPARASR